MVYIQIDPATAKDSEDLWRWRNDPQTRLMSLNGEEISFDSHTQWFNNALRNPLIYMFLGSLSQETEKIGVCRFNFQPDGTTAEISINLNPKMRGKKLSTVFLKAAIQYLKNIRKRPFSILATVKKSNVVSQKCFERCGFSVTNTGPDSFLYKL
jgi:RimJ/RimL family protein N-acetyltransferase